MTTFAPAVDAGSLPARGGPSAARLALAAGAGYGVLQIAMAAVFGVLILPRMGAPDAAPAAHLAAYVENGGLLRAGNFLLTVPTPLFLFFLAGLHDALRRAGGSAVAAAAASLAGVATAMLWPLSAVLNDLAVDIARHGGDAATITALDAIGPYLLALGASGRVVLLVAAGAVLRRSGAVPAWVGVLGLAAAGASAVGSLTLLDGRAFPALALGTLAFDAWLVGVSVALLRAPSDR